MSDGPAPASDYGLSGGPAAIIIYTIIVNNAVPFNNLATSDINDIFNGTKTNWDQIRGPGRPPRPGPPDKDHQPLAWLGVTDHIRPACARAAQYRSRGELHKRRQSNDRERNRLR